MTENEFKAKVNVALNNTLRELCLEFGNKSNKHDARQVIQLSLEFTKEYAENSIERLAKSELITDYVK